MRRKDKAINDKKDIEKIFLQAHVCRLGFFDGVKPYIVPMNYGYKDEILYFHSASEGRKMDIMRGNPEICFEIDIPGKLIDSEKACSWSMSYQSIMGDGKIVFLNDEDEKSAALNIIMGHYSGKTEWDFPREMMAKISVFKVKIGNISAKRSGVLV